MTYDAQRDYDDYLANTPESTRDPGVLKALTGAIKRDAAAKAADGPGFIPPVVDSTVEKSTAEFLAEQNQLEWKRRNQVDVDAVLADLSSTPRSMRNGATQCLVDTNSAWSAARRRSTERCREREPSRIRRFERAQSARALAALCWRGVARRRPRGNASSRSDVDPYARLASEYRFECRRRGRLRLDPSQGKRAARAGVYQRRLVGVDQHLCLAWRSPVHAAKRSAGALPRHDQQLAERHALRLGGRRLGDVHRRAGQLEHGVVSKRRQQPPEPPMSTRDHVEALHRIAAAAARPPLQPDPRPDALLSSPSWVPTDGGITSPQSLFDALRTQDREALSRAWIRRNRRHPLSLP